MLARERMDENVSIIGPVYFVKGRQTRNHEELGEIPSLVRFILKVTTEGHNGGENFCS